VLTSVEEQLCGKHILCASSATSYKHPNWLSCTLVNVVCFYLAIHSSTKAIKPLEDLCKHLALLATKRYPSQVRR
jgi:hypothetical protein